MAQTKKQTNKKKPQPTKKKTTPNKKKSHLGLIYTLLWSPRGLKRKICSSLLHRKEQQGSGEFIGRSSSEGKRRNAPSPGMSARARPRTPLCAKKSHLSPTRQNPIQTHPPSCTYPALLAANKMQDPGNCMEVTNLPVCFPTGSNKNQTKPLKKKNKKGNYSFYCGQSQALLSREICSS